MRKRTNTLSDALLADVREATRRVLTQGSSSGTSRPFGDGEDSGQLWIKITSSSTATTNVYRYGVSVFRNPFVTGATPIATGRKARNANEIGGTNIRAGGYSLQPSAQTGCADKSLMPVPNDTYHAVIDRYYDADADEWYFAFVYKNDTVISGA